jgi:hypothetical protein
VPGRYQEDSGLEVEFPDKVSYDFDFALSQDGDFFNTVSALVIVFD